MTELVIVIPTRGRPSNAEAALTTIDITSTADRTVVLAIDADDPMAPEYQQIAAGRAMLYVLPESAGHVAAINAAAVHAVHELHPFAVVKLDDDHRPRSYGWDEDYLRALHGLGSGICYGNDLLQGENMPTAPGMTADIIRTLGFMAPPELGHLYCDNFWKDLATAAGCLHYLDRVVVEHVHPGAGKATWDAGYARVNSPQRYAADGAAYQRYCDTRMADDVRAVQNLRTPR